MFIGIINMLVQSSIKYNKLRMSKSKLLTEKDILSNIKSTISNSTNSFIPDIISIKDFENQLLKSNFDQSVQQECTNISNNLVKKSNIRQSVKQDLDNNINYNINNNDKFVESICEETIQNMIVRFSKQYPVIRSPSIFSIPIYLKKNIFDTQSFSNKFNEDCYDLIVKFEENSIIKYVRWEDKLDSLDTDYNLNSLNDIELKNKIQEIVLYFIEKFTNCQVFDSLDELYNYLKINCIFRSCIKIKKMLGIQMESLEDNIIKRNSMSLINILESIKIIIYNFDQLEVLHNYLLKNLPHKKRKKSLIRYPELTFELIDFTWDELGSIKCLIIDWYNFINK